MNTKLFKLPQFTAEVILPKQYNETKLVVAGGRTPEVAWLGEVAATKKLYCADKGIEVCLQANLVPTALFGDGDSGSKDAYEKAQNLGTKLETFPVEKDDTDLQLVLQNLEDSDLICTGVWGGRFDHLYSNVFSLLSYKEAHQAQVILVDEKEAMLLVTAKEAVKISLHKKVKALSLLPLSEVNKVTLKNVRWELQEAELKLLHPYAISNIPLDEFIFECLDGKIGLYLCFEE